MHSESAEFLLVPSALAVRGDRGQFHCAASAVPRSGTVPSHLFFHDVTLHLHFSSQT